MMVKLGDICEILDNKRVPITAKDREKGIYPYYGANGIQDYVSDYIFDDELVLLAEDGGNFGSKEKPIAYRVSGKCWVNNHAHVLKPKQGLDVDYLCYSLMFYDVSNLINGATRQKLTQTDMRKMEIPLPPLEEQRKIAETLDKVSDLIAKRKQQLEKLDLLVKSKFVEMFGDPFVNPKSWNIVVFSDIIQNANNGMARRGNDLDGDIDYSSPNRIILNEAEKKRYRLLDKDFLFARVNGNPDNVGRCAVFNDIKDPVYHNDHIIRVHFNDELVNGTFLSVLLNSEYGKSEMRNKIKTSAGQYTISQDGIGAVKSILPPIKFQTQFAEFVQQTEHTKSIIKQSLEKLETLKKALMQEYFG